VTRYVVVQCGDLNRGEKMNCAVLAWDSTLGDDSPVSVYVISDWARIRTAFWPSHVGWTTDDLTNDITSRILAIKTLGDFRQVFSTMGPYTPFDFTDERTAAESPEKTAAGMADYFLHRKV
jgi:hypothetical protein